jgi:hypothetical protein
MALYENQVGGPVNSFMALTIFRIALWNFSAEENDSMLLLFSALN